MIDMAKNIRSLREGLGLKRPDFASSVGVSADTIGNIENGRQRVNHEILLKLRQVYDIDLNELFSGNLGDVSYPKRSEFAQIQKMTISGSDAGDEPLIFDGKWLSDRKLDPSTIRAWTVQGDSMEPHLRDGIVILFDQSQTEPIQGKTYVLKIGKTVTVNYVQHLGASKLRFLSANTIYGHSDFDPEADADQFQILGRVVAAIQDF